MKCERLVRVPAHYLSLGSGLKINTLFTVSPRFKHLPLFLLISFNLRIEMVQLKMDWKKIFSLCTK